MQHEENAIEHDLTCAGCRRSAITPYLVHAGTGARLCDDCATRSDRIDHQLDGVKADDPVSCDDCARPVDFDARLAVVVRGCAGRVLCGNCRPVNEGAPS